MKSWPYAGIHVFIYYYFLEEEETEEVVFFSRHLSVCLSVCQQLHMKTADLSFMKLSPKMYLWTSKIALNFWNEDPKTENFATLFIIYRCEWPHRLAAVACIGLALFIADDIIVRL